MIIYTYFTLSFCLRSRHFSILVSIIGIYRFYYDWDRMYEYRIDSWIEGQL